MKYVGNGFSMGMVPDEQVYIKVDTITKKQFMNASTHAKSIIGHPEIAENFNLPLNRESITLQKGDILYIVSPTRRLKEGEIVENGTTYTFVPESMGYTYKQIQILK